VALNSHSDDQFQVYYGQWYVS